MSNLDTLGELLRASRVWLDQAAVHFNEGAVSLAGAAASIGHGYACLADAHTAAAVMSTQDRARVDFPLDEAETAPPLPVSAWPSSATMPAPTTTASGVV